MTSVHVCNRRALAITGIGVLQIPNLCLVDDVAIGMTAFYRPNRQDGHGSLFPQRMLLQA